MLERDAKVILKALLVKYVSYQEYGHVLNDILVLATDFVFAVFPMSSVLANQGHLITLF